MARWIKQARSSIHHQARTREGAKGKGRDELTKKKAANPSQIDRDSLLVDENRSHVCVWVGVCGCVCMDGWCDGRRAT